jgi:hypothetical protein
MRYSQRSGTVQRAGRLARNLRCNGRAVGRDLRNHRAMAARVDTRSRALWSYEAVKRGCFCQGEVGARRGWGDCGGLDLPERLCVERLLSDERRVVHAQPRSKLGTLPSEPERSRTSRPNQWQPTSEQWISTAGRAGTIRPIACLYSQREFRRRKRTRAICRPIRRPVVSVTALGGFFSCLWPFCQAPAARVDGPGTASGRVHSVRKHGEIRADAGRRPATRSYDRKNALTFQRVPLSHYLIGTAQSQYLGS